MNLIPLHNKIGEVVAYAAVDSADYTELTRHSWCYHSSGGYAKRGEQRGGKSHTVLMHRQVAGACADQDVDHKNGNGLDNRRDNLRICNDSQNQGNTGPNRANTTGYKGVSYNKRDNVFEAWGPRTRRRRAYLGRFETAAEAARSYDQAALLHFGQFAWTNFPREDY